MAHIPFLAQNSGVDAFQNMRAAEIFTADDWSSINYQSLTVRQAAAIMSMEQQQLQQFIPEGDHKIFQVSNDGIVSLMVVDDLAALSFKVVSK